MKRRSLILVLILIVTIVLSACGQEKNQDKKDQNPFVGTWSGSLNLTDQIVQEIITQSPSLKEFAHFENLIFTLEFTFAEDTVSLGMNEESGKQFISNIETGIANMVDAMVANASAENNISQENVYAAMNVTREEFIQSIIESMQLEQMVNEIAEAYDLDGEYEYDKESIFVYYDDNTYEEMNYSFQGDKLLITISDGTSTHIIQFSK